MKDKLIKLLKSEINALTTEEIVSKLNLNTDEILEVQKILNDMVQKGEIYYTKKGKYILFENCRDLEIGVLDVNKKGFGFLLMKDKEDIHIERKYLNGAIDKDKVIVEIIGRGEKPEGRVLKIVERNLNNLVGEVYKEKNKFFLRPEDKRNITIELSDKTTKDVVEGTIAVVKIYKEVRENYYLADITNIVGHKDDAGVDILTIAYKHEIFPEFSDAAMKQTEEIENEVNEKELGGRRDLTGEMIFTIDGDDTKDIDDAISLNMEGGNYVLGVHIADVSHYVTEGSPLDENAKEKGTSSYLADTVIPMLPHKLSNGICSLNEGVIRLTQSCVMTINHQGKIIDYDIFPSYIKSRKKMTYKNVNEILMRNNVPEGYDEFKDKLIKMNELAHILRKEKSDRGYIDFDIDEPKIICNEEGRCIDVQRRLREDGEKLIENFMIAANETIASHLSNMELPSLYRVHDKPDEEKLQNFVKITSALGYPLKGKVKAESPKNIQELLVQLKDKPEINMLSEILLRSMKKAKYQSENIGHFGLGSKAYTHFTSPIRRYPDLIIHRLLRTYLYENKIDKKTVSYYENLLPSLGDLSSEREVKAVEAEREVDSMKMAEYMEGHILDEFEGRISGLTNFGFFVELDNLVEGLVHLSTLTDDYYAFDKDLMEIIGGNSKKKYRLGDKVRIKVVGANKENKTIDFELVDDYKKNN